MSDWWEELATEDDEYAAEMGLDGCFWADGIRTPSLYQSASDFRFLLLLRESMESDAPVEHLEYLEEVFRRWETFYECDYKGDVMELYLSIGTHIAVRHAMALDSPNPEIQRASHRLLETVREEERQRDFDHFLQELGMAD